VGRGHSRSLSRGLCDRWHSGRVSPARRFRRVCARVNGP
jgi:hypothetical protein